MRRRLLLSYLSITIFVLLALGLPLGLSFANAERTRLTSQVQAEGYALAVRADESLVARTPEAAEALDALAGDFRAQTGFGALIVDADGGVVASAGPGEPPGTGMAAGIPEVAAALGGRQVTRERAIEGREVVVVAVPVLAGSDAIGAVRVSAPLDVVAHRTREHWLLLGGLAGVIALVVLLVSILLARSFTRPLAALDAGAARLGEGDLGARVPVPADPPELRGLARSFNSTAERLETLVQSQQSFVADASHQLRTPLAALSLRLENLEAEGRDFRAEDLDGALAEVRRLARLVDGLLVLARAEQAPAATATVGLRDVVAGRVDAWGAVAGERSISLVSDVDELAVRSVPGRLEQVLDNLLSNALDVAPEGSEVSILAESEGEQVRIEVRDRGPGMTPSQRARAFDRFWRADPTRKHRGGFGLGLAIVHRLVRADGGDVRLGEAPGGGLAVILVLPAARRGAPVPV